MRVERELGSTSEEECTRWLVVSPPTTGPQQGERYDKFPVIERGCNYSLHRCLCGFLGDSQHECTCAPQQVQRYRAKISGPLLDRIDIQIEVPAVKYKELSQHLTSEGSATIRVRVNRAREVQLQRFAGRTLFCNAQMTSRDIRKFCQPDASGEKLLESAMARLGLSARAYTRILKVARTIADLAGEEKVGGAHLAEAIQYRALDRK